MKRFARMGVRSTSRQAVAMTMQHSNSRHQPRPPHATTGGRRSPAACGGGRRCGSTLWGLMAAIGFVGAFAAVVYVLVPTNLHGGSASSPAQPIEATHEDNQLLIESLAALIGHSAEVVAIHPRTASPYMEIVLILHGTVDSDETPAEQVALISHSSVLHTVMLYTFERDSIGPGSPGGSPGTERSGGGAEQSRAAKPPRAPGLPVAATAPAALTRQELANPGFCDRWRSNPAVQPRLLARGISDMNVQVLDQIGQHANALRLSLTWSSDSADGEDSAAVLVNAVIRRAP